MRCNDLRTCLSIKATMISGQGCEGLGGRRIDRTLVWVYPFINDREERAKMQLVKSTVQEHPRSRSVQVMSVSICRRPPLSCILSCLPSTTKTDRHHHPRKDPWSRDGRDRPACGPLTMESFLSQREHV